MQRQKSPPVAIGSAEAAARLATGQVVEKVESDIIPARRGQLGKEEKQRRWTGKRTISKKEDVKEENTDNPGDSQYNVGRRSSVLRDASL